MNFFDDFIEKSANVADKVAKVAGEYIDKGKDKIDEMNLRSELSKAQRQLGVLVYTMHKTGEHNEELFQQYIDDIDKIEKQIENLNAETEAAEEAKEVVIKFCSNCGTQVSVDDSFCKNCGNSVK